MTRKDAIAGVVLAVLSLMVVVGWWCVPGESGGAVGSQPLTPTPPHGDGTLTYTAVTASGSGSGAVTATIVGFMIFGAMLIGLFFYSPRPVPVLAVKQQQPRRSGAVVVNTVALQTVSAAVRQIYSSIAPGAVLETVIRNSALLLVFFNRSTSRSMA